MPFADLPLLARLNKYAEELHYRRAFGNGKPHPSHTTEQLSDEEIIRELIRLADEYAATWRAYLPMAVVKGKR